MTDAWPKRVVLTALGYRPDFFELRLPDMRTKAGQSLLHWLDRGGLALPFYKRLLEYNAASQISEPWHHALSQRHARNVIRTRDMLVEIRRITQAFGAFGVSAAALKGFTLTPDFCEDPSFRHQVDFDFLVAPESVKPAAEALGSCGYSTSLLNESGETCFRTPLQHIPSAGDDLYAVQRHRQADLHTSLWEPCAWLPMEIPADCLENVRLRNIAGVEFLCLSLEDAFLMQVLHAFRHATRSWTRVSWLLEIAKCAERHQSDASLWNRVILRAGNARLMKSAFAFVLGLVARLFQTPMPAALCSWTSEAMTVSLRTWLDHFGFDWAIADWPGSLNNLFLTAEFVPDRALRMQYWRSRLLPGKTQASLGSVAATSPGRLFHVRAAQLSYAAHRAALHVKDIATLPRQQFRWKRALASARKPVFDLNC